MSATSRAFECRRGSNRQAARRRYSSYQSAILRRLAPMVSTSNVVPSVRLAPVPGALRHADQRAGYSGIGLRSPHYRCFGSEVGLACPAGDLPPMRLTKRADNCRLTLFRFAYSAATRRTLPRRSCDLPHLDALLPLRAFFAGRYRPRPTIDTEFGHSHVMPPRFVTPPRPRTLPAQFCVSGLSVVHRNPVQLLALK